MDRFRTRSQIAALLAIIGLAFVAAPGASAATLTYSTGAAGATLTYTGVDTAETVSIESLSNTSVKYFNMAASQIVAPLPSGCTSDPTRKTDQIVTCTIDPIDHISMVLAGGGDTLSESGLSKPSDISGGDGNDSIVGGSLTDVINGDGGTDTINAGPGDDTVSAQDGLADTINCGNGTDTESGDTIDKLTGCEHPTSSDALVTDKDGDGYSPPADCDDTRADIHPGATDTPGDGIDQDCSGTDAALPAGSGGAGSGASTTPATTPSSTTTPTTNTASTGTGAGSGVATNNPVVDGASTSATNTSTGTFGIATTSGTTGITTTNTSTTAGGAPVAHALIIAANPSITFRLVRARHYTRATKITVAPVPAGATVTVTCKGSGCPAKGYKKTFPAGLDHLIVRSLFDLARLQRGAKIRIQVTKPGVIGRAVRYTVNSLTAPDAEASCLAAGTSARTTC